MAATVKLILRSDKQKADGTSPIWLRVTANRKSRYVSTKISVPEALWDAKKQRVKKKHEIAPASIGSSRRYYTKPRRKRSTHPLPLSVKASIGASGGSLTAYFDRSSRGSTRKADSGTGRSTELHLASFKSASDSISTGANWTGLPLTASRSVCGRSTRTIRRRAQGIGSSPSSLPAGDKDGVIDGPDPFLTYDMPKGSKPERRKLSIEEVERMAALDLEPGSPDG